MRKSQQNLKNRLLDCHIGEIDLVLLLILCENKVGDKKQLVAFLTIITVSLAFYWKAGLATH